MSVASSSAASASSRAVHASSSASSVRVLDAFHHTDPDSVVTALALDEDGGRVFIGEIGEREERARPMHSILGAGAADTMNAVPSLPPRPEGGLA